MKTNKRIDTLIAELRSKDGVQRERARNALVNIGKPAVPFLEEHFDSPDVRQGAHHVLHALARQKLLNQDTLAVLDKLSYLEPNSSVAWAAQKALNSIGKTGQ